MAPLRGLYSGEPEAMAVIRMRGGWHRMTAALAARAGLVRGKGAAGELGLVRLNDGFALAVGLGGNQWAGRIDGGFQTVMSAARSWSVG